MNFSRFRDSGLEKRFRDYALSFADDGAFLKLVNLKIAHTFDVCSITGRIAGSESFFCDPEPARIAYLTALFHDISRFVQLRDFHTFNDADSFDHGDRSAAIIESGEFDSTCSKDEMPVVCDAIRFHNKIGIPPYAGLDVMPFARLIRDSDKLSILKIVTAYIVDPSNRDDEVISLGNLDTPGFSENVALSAEAGRQIPHSMLRNVNDFKLAFFSWTADLNFPESARYALEHKLFDNIRKTLPDAALIDRVSRAAAARLERLANGECPHASPA